MNGCCAWDNPGDWLCLEYGDRDSRFITGDRIEVFSVGALPDTKHPLLALHIAHVDGAWYVKTESHVEGNGWKGPFLATGRSFAACGPHHSRHDALVAGLTLLDISASHPTNGGRPLPPLLSRLKGKIMEAAGVSALQADLFSEVAV